MSHTTTPVRSRNARYRQWAQNDKTSSTPTTPPTPTTPSDGTPTTTTNTGVFITSSTQRSGIKKRTTTQQSSVSTGGIIVKETKHNNVNKLTIQRVDQIEEDDSESETDEPQNTLPARKKFHNEPPKNTIFSVRHKLDEDEDTILTESDTSSSPTVGTTFEEDLDVDAYEFSYETLLAYEYEDDDEFDPFRFIANLPPKTKISSSSYCLPPKTPNSPPVTLVLDLDETLVHCSTDPMRSSDFVFPVLFHGIEYQVYARKRPYFEEFLKRVSKCFEVVVFTASQKVYADKLLDILDPKNMYIHHRVFRDSCVPVDGNYLKDLEVLGRDLSKVIILDNSPQAYGYQIDNGIPILSWFDNENDEELMKLLPFLKKCLHVNDVRPLVQKKFKLRELIEKYKRKSDTEQLPTNLQMSVNGTKVNPR
jgi:CTD small phosphatase-like protein 2